MKRYIIWFIITDKEVRKTLKYDQFWGEYKSPKETIEACKKQATEQKIPINVIGISIFNGPKEIFTNNSFH